MNIPFAVAALVAVQVAGYRVEPAPGVPPGAEVRVVQATENGAVWVGVRGEGLLRVKGSTVERVGEDELGGLSVADVLEAEDGRVWAAGLGGYAVRGPAGWSTSSEVASITPRVVFSLHEERRSGAVWFAASGGAGRLDDGEWSMVLPEDGLPNQVVHAVHVDRRGAIWLACRTGLVRFLRGVRAVLFPEVNFRSVVEDGDGVLWFGTSAGVLAWDGSEWSQHLDGMTVLPRLVASDGAIWAGSAADGVFRYDADEWLSVPLPEEYGGVEVFDVTEARDGSIWVATAVGALRLTPR